MFRWAAVGLMAAALLAGCTSARQTQPPRTATEQLLISTAAERAAERLELGLPAGTKVLVDATGFEGIDHKYAVATIKGALLRQGLNLVRERREAEVVVEIRAGALSIDERETLFGLQSFDLPLPFTESFTTPELALFKRQTRQGVAKLAAAAYDADDGSLRASVAPVYGFSHGTRWVVLLFLGWTTSDLIPPDVRAERGWLDRISRPGEAW